jgi:hypothetical protein
MSILRVLAKDFVGSNEEQTEATLGLQNESSTQHEGYIKSDGLRKRKTSSINVTEDSELTGNTQVKTMTFAEKELMVSWRRILLLIMAVTVHNIPEGLAVGVGFGSIGSTKSATFESAFNLVSVNYSCLFLIYRLLELGYKTSQKAWLSAYHCLALDIHDSVLLSMDS